MKTSSVLKVLAFDYLEAAKASKVYHNNDLVPAVILHSKIQNITKRMNNLAEIIRLEYSNLNQEIEDNLSPRSFLELCQRIVENEKGFIIFNELGDAIDNVNIRVETKYKVTTNGFESYIFSTDKPIYDSKTEGKYVSFRTTYVRNSSGKLEIGIFPILNDNYNLYSEYNVTKLFANPLDIANECELKCGKEKAKYDIKITN